MKRIISIIITAALVFSLCLTSAYATVRPVTAAKSDIAAGLLKYLKIMEITDENSEITRADFACYVARALGVNEYSKPAQMYFF